MTEHCVCVFSETEPKPDCKQAEHMQSYIYFLSPLLDLFYKNTSFFFFFCDALKLILASHLCYGAVLWQQTHFSDLPFFSFLFWRGGLCHQSCKTSCCQVIDVVNGNTLTVKQLNEVSPWRLTATFFFFFFCFHWQCGSVEGGVCLLASLLIQPQICS